MTTAADTCAVDALPPTVRPLLWAYRLEQGTDLPIAVVAAAVMDRGDLAAMRWLISTLGRPRLAALLPSIARRLSPRSQALWSCVLDQPRRPSTCVPWVAT
jgi:hypothetical protein